MKHYKNFISFEGIDFCGKTTQINRLMDRFNKMNLTIYLLREPGGTIISEKVREILLDKTHAEMHPRTEILLYSAARAQLVHQTILPLLETGKYVIADRFFDSTTAYQGTGRNLDIHFVKQLNRFATSGLLPDKTFLLDISPREALRRRDQGERRSDRLENEQIDFYRSIRESYLDLCKESPERFIIIPGEASIEEVSDTIWEKISEIWKLSPAGK